jgi:arylsulfatase A-like enzyme
MKVLVLAVPGLHLGYLGCYGSDWVRTPSLDRLAAQGIVFDQHYADCPSPSPLIQGPADGGPNRSWWTGRYRFPGLEGQDEMPAEEPGQLFPLLDAHGIGTARVIAPGRFKDARQASSLRFPIKKVREALAHVECHDHWLLWADLPDLAPPWRVPAEDLSPYFPEEAGKDEELLTPWTDPPAGFLDPADGTARERLQATYAAAVTYFDAQLGLLLKELDAHAGQEDLMLVLTADRGLALGEHGIVAGYRPWLHEELLHLPLLIRLPGGAEAGRRIAALTQPVDLFPTLLNAFGLAPGEVHGRDLLPLMRGATAQVRPYACAGLALGGAVEYALRTAEWALLLPVQAILDEALRRPQLYVKPDDRWEVNNVLQQHLELVEQLEQKLRGFVAATRPPRP